MSIVESSKVSICFLVWKMTGCFTHLIDFYIAIASCQMGLTMIHFPNIDPVAFTIPLIELQVRWYGIIFAFAMISAASLYSNLLENDGISKLERRQHIDFCFPMMIFCTLFFARLFEAIFYSPQLLLSFQDFFNFRGGGLASHGAIIGTIIAVTVSPSPKGLNECGVFDRISIVSVVAGIFIRIGNFINQELLGTHSAMPWAIIYRGEDSIARHPVVLYEALGYAMIFAIIWCQRYRISLKTDPSKRLPDGLFACLNICAISALRFFCEYFKEEQSQWFIPFESISLTMGQVLSLMVLAAIITAAPICYRCNGENKRKAP